MHRLDLIIDALEVASHVPKGVVYPAGYPMQIAQALAAARELRELKPVAWLYRGQLHDLDPAQWSLFPETATPLYALDEVTK